MDLTDLWVMFSKRQHLLLQLIIAILLVGTGWQAGRVMSPYYAASPIVFQNRECNGCSSSGGAPEQLDALREQGSAVAAASPTPALSPSSSPAVAGARSDTTDKQYVASVNSNLYHDKSCPSAKRIKPENQVWFNTTAEAEAAGYSPSACTQQLLENTK